MTLTDEQCVKFLRRPGSSYDMVRAIYAAGQESMRAKLDEQWNDGFDKGKAAGRKAGLEEAAEKAYATIMRHPGPTDAEAAATAAAIRALSNAD
jgi:flagellar biosynthesis/type III secretory pathway protein FliH